MASEVAADRGCASALVEMQRELIAGETGSPRAADIGRSSRPAPRSRSS